MSKPIATLAAICIILAAGCASGPSGKSFDSALGEWSWRASGPNHEIKGRMTIIDQTRATYTYRNGSIYFYSVDKEKRTWEGYWVEPWGPYSCSEDRHGSRVWGVTKFRFNEAYNVFEGEHDICGEGARYPWNGYR